MGRIRNTAVSVPADRVATLQEVAERLADLRGWPYWRAKGDRILYRSSEDPGTDRVLDASGAAYRVLADGRHWPDDGDSVDWAREFPDWKGCTWARSGRKFVVIHG